MPLQPRWRCPNRCPVLVAVDLRHGALLSCASGSPIKGNQMVLISMDVVPL